MADPAASFRIIVEQIADTGESPETSYDETFSLDGFEEDVSKRILLEAADADVAVTFTAGISVLVFSIDNPFKMRLAGGETLMDNLRLFLVVCDDEDDEALSTSILLTGNGANQSRIRFLVLEKPA